MARVHHRKAAKDYPEHGIAKGEMYYYAKIKTGQRSSRELRSKTRFKRSQLTVSEFKGTLYDIEDDLAAIASIDDIPDIAERLRTLAGEQEEKFDAMPEGLQQGDTGTLLTERKEACETAADELDEIHQRADDWRGNYSTEHDEWLAADEEDRGEEPEDQEEDFLQEARDVSIDV